MFVPGFDYDSIRENEVSYEELLEKYWDQYVGPAAKCQYRSAIWARGHGGPKGSEVRVVCLGWRGDGTESEQNGFFSVYPRCGPYKFTRVVFVLILEILFVMGNTRHVELWHPPPPPLKEVNITPDAGTNSSSLEVSDGEQKRLAEDPTHPPRPPKLPHSLRVSWGFLISGRQVLSKSGFPCM